MRSHVDWRGERNIPYKSVETSTHIRVLKPRGKAEIPTRFKTLRGSLESPNRTIFARRDHISNNFKFF